MADSDRGQRSAESAERTVLRAALPGRPEAQRVERESGVMGRRAVIDASPRQAPVSAPEGVAPTPFGTSGDVTIQRRVGFEFETHAHIYRKYNNHSQLINDEAEIFRGVDWKLVSDSGRMEFVSDPFDTLASFLPIIAAITTFIQNSLVPLNTDIRGRNNGNWQPAAGDSIVTTSEDELNRQPVNAQTFYGNPQVSVGVRMESLARFLTRLSKAEPMRELRRQLTGDHRPARANPLYPGTTSARVANVGKLLGATDAARIEYTTQKATVLVEKYRTMSFNGQRVPQQDMQKLEGLWRLMANYWQWLGRWSSGQGYVKASLPAMARTDFHSMYRDLGPVARLAYADARDYFVGRNIPLRAKSDRGPMVEGQGFRVSDWYDSVANPAASQHTFNGQVRNVDLVSNDQTIATGTNKSMGQMGMDSTTGAVNRAVFELRRVTGGVNIPLAYLYPHVLTPVFNLLQHTGA